jgi:serine/threonine-protein kinase RsbW
MGILRPAKKAVRGEGELMEITLSLTLPRDAESVPVGRHVVKAAMENVGVADDCVHDIEVAVSEACGNVLRHSGPGDEYELSFRLDKQVCTLRVVDTGHGFDCTTLAEGPGDHSAERGRGISLMHALVDKVRFESKPEAGTIVHLEKSLELIDGSLLARAIQGNGGR